MKTLNKYYIKIYFKFKKWKYSFFSNNKRVEGNYIDHQPVVIRGKGIINFGKDVEFGVINSPMLYNSYAYLESRNINSIIEIGDGVKINNGCKLTAEKKIKIGENTLIGFNCLIIDSNFHDLDPINRINTDTDLKNVEIGSNVLIGHNVTILKGVSIGNNSVVGANSVLTQTYPENVVIAGNPAKIVSKLT